jgi:hypothetical protein
MHVTLGLMPCTAKNREREEEKEREREREEGGNEGGYPITGLLRERRKVMDKER